MATVAQVGWGSYLGFEGPFYRGQCSFTLPDNPTDDDRVMAVTTATEGGHLDAINGYDRMIISVGAIQFGEAGQYSVSDMLGAVNAASPDLLEPLQPALLLCNASFKPNAKNRSRFFFNDSRGEVDTVQEQHQLFQLHANGNKGTWDDSSKTYAKTWAASVASVFEQPEAQAAQTRFTVARLRLFAMPDVRAALFDGTPGEGLVGAARAIFLSYAVNLPVVAAAQYKTFVAGTHAPKWSADWVIGLARQLTFGPNIALYPHRWNAIRPVVEKLYGVNLPDFAVDLQKWQAANNVDLSSTKPSFMSTKEVQTELVAEGYDLGPAGADGTFGPKTLAAIEAFQQGNGLKPDGVVGPNTRKALVAKYESRVQG